MVLRILVVLTYQVWSGNEIRDVTFEIYCEEGGGEKGVPNGVHGKSGSAVLIAVRAVL